MSKRRNAFNVQSYMPATTVANLVIALRLTNVPVPTSLSGLLRYCANIVIANILPENKRINSTEEALSFLHTQGFTTKQIEDPKRNAGTVRQTREEDATIEGFVMNPPQMVDELRNLLIREEEL